MKEVGILTGYSDLVMIQYCQYFHCVGFAVKFQEAGDGFGAGCEHTSYTDHINYHIQFSGFKEIQDINLSLTSKPTVC